MLKDRLTRNAPTLTALALVVASGCANAALPSFAVLDQDRDGFISESEAKASPAVQSAFAAADANGDGKLSPDEFETIEG